MRIDPNESHPPLMPMPLRRMTIWRSNIGLKMATKKTKGSAMRNCRKKKPAGVPLTMNHTNGRTSSGNMAETVWCGKDTAATTASSATINLARGSRRCRDESSAAMRS